MSSQTVISEPHKLVGVAWRLFARIATRVTRDGLYHAADSTPERMLAFAFGEGAFFHPKNDRSVAATRRFDKALSGAPDSPFCHYMLSANLRRSGGFERAGEIMRDAVRRFPDSLGTTIEAALVAERLGDFAEAQKHWRKASGMAPPRVLWQCGDALALIAVGRFDEAERLLTTARAARPDDRGLMYSECVLASSREDWATAIPLWTEFNRRFPKFADCWEHLGRAIHSSRLSRIEERAGAAENDAAPVDVGRVEDEATRALLLGFQSLGDNCEFGLVQRRFGAEPLDLLRWNLVDDDSLVDALAANLDGLGAPEHTEMIVLANGEFFVYDDRWFLGMHTYIFSGQASPEILYPKMCERLAILKTRFMADLGAGEKIFVYRSPGLARQALTQLHQALSRYGPVTLLLVQPARSDICKDFAGQPGDLSVVAPGLFVGFIRRLGVAPDNTWNIAFDDWVSVCRAAAAKAAAPCENV